MFYVDTQVFLCGGEMRIIAFIEDHKVIDRIIRHLKLTFEAEPPPPPRITQQKLLMATEEKGSISEGPFWLLFVCLWVEVYLIAVCLAFLVNCLFFSP